MSTKQLNNNQIAPNIKLLNLDGKSVNLSDFKGKKVWLSFYRFTGCPVCNLRIESLRKAVPELQKNGLVKLAVFQTPVKKMQKAIDRDRYTFEFISDETGSAYQTFGVGSSMISMMNPRAMMAAMSAMTRGHMMGVPDGPMGRTPADFLIDEAGVIQTAYYGKHMGDHINIDVVKNFVKNQ